MSADPYPRRIVCLTEETTEILYSLGEAQRIVGISGFTVRPPEARKEKPKVSAFLSADVPKVLALEPDLVLGFSDLQADIARELVRHGLSVWVSNQRSVEELFANIVMVGSLVGRSAEAVAMVEKFRREHAATRERAQRRGRRPRVFFEEWPDPLICGIRWVSELIDIAGGDDVCAEESRQRLGKDRVIGAETVAARRPDLILASWCGKRVDRTVIRARPGWSELEAARADRIVEIDSNLILQPGPAALGDGLGALEAAILTC